MNEMIHYLKIFVSDNTEGQVCGVEVKLLVMI